MSKAESFYANSFFRKFCSVSHSPCCSSSLFPNYGLQQQQQQSFSRRLVASEMAVRVISFLYAASSGKKLLFPAALLLLFLLSEAAVAVPVSEFSSPVKVPVFSSLLLCLFLSLSTVASWYSQQDGKGQPLEAELSSQPSSAQQHPSPSINLRTWFVPYPAKPHDLLLVIFFRCFQVFATGSRCYF